MSENSISFLNISGGENRVTQIRRFQCCWNKIVSGWIGFDYAANNVNVPTVLDNIVKKKIRVTSIADIIDKTLLRVAPPLQLNNDKKIYL